MFTSKNWLLRWVMPTLAMLGAAIGWSSPSQAYVQQIVIDQTATVNYSPIPLGSSTPGSPTSYTVYQGRIFGVVNPSNPLNSLITDINNAAPVVSGSPNISYIADFQIVTPTNPAARSGLLIYEVPNRGGNAINTSALIQGTTYVQSGWQGDLLSECSLVTPAPYPCINLNSGPYGTLNPITGVFTPPTAAGLIPGTTNLTSYVIQVPVATTDGNAPNGTNTITGPVYSHISPGLSGSTAQLIIGNSPDAGGVFTPYQPVSSDTNQASLWSVATQTVTDGVDGPKTPIASAAWSWAYCPNGSSGAGYTPSTTWICLNGANFNPNLLYEISFTAANPLVLGVGYAATRDFVSFLRFGTTAPGGGSNPISGSVTMAMGIGGSQSGSFLRGSIFYGFNEDEDGRIVLDGSWPEIDGRMLWLNQRWAQPTVLTQLNMGGDEAPVWWADFPNQARGLPADGILHRCNATGTCPQILETFGELEWYGEKMGPDFTGFCVVCTTDIPVPSNVYRYYYPGTTHGGGSGGFTWTAPPTTLPVSAGQMFPSNPNPETQSNNALQADFIAFLMNGTPMPASFGGPGGTYPTLASAELAPNTASATGFPNIPSFPYGGNNAWPPFVYNFGPGVNYDQETGVPTINPPIVQQVLTPYVPTVNSDGNDNVGSDPSVLFQAPLGTYTGWNIIPGPTSVNGPYVGQQDNLSGGYWPFYQTAALRTTAGDPRPSLEERYGTHLGYNCVARVAANRTVAKRFLLASDATTLMSQLAAGNVLTSGFTPTAADANFANNILCGLTVAHNFNGDAFSDILWRDTSGDLAVWLMNGGTITQSAGVGTVPGNFSVVGQKDFNGDGNADILWRDTTGNVSMWFMNGAAVASTAAVGNVPDNWTIYGTADLNGDGKGDLLWRDNNTGTVALWFMNGATVASSKNLGAVPATWTIVGDANGGILWRDTAGDIALWTVQNGQVTGSAALGTVPGNFVVQGVGDFNGDGFIDILWRDIASGTLSIWFTNGTQVTSTASVGVLPSNWNVAQVGDYNGDGYSDILLIDTAGDLAEWLMSGATVSSSVGVGNVGTTWTVQNVNAQ